ncbi:MAG: hypothetical protein IPP47_07090 [Bryobacterales bacterium]|nr:hypothetical protein [Bryobacterales bacterium]
MLTRNMTRIALLSVVAQALLLAQITVTADRAVLQSQSLQRVIQFKAGNVQTVSLAVAGRELLAAPAREFSVSIAREKSNRAPRGLRAGETLESHDFSGTKGARWRGDAFDPARYDDARPDAPVWIDTRTLTAGSWATYAGKPVTAITQPSPGVTRLSIRTELTGDPVLAGVAIEQNYDVHDGFPAVRKFVTLRNGSGQWLRLSRLVIDDLQLSPLTSKPLAVGLFGVQPSVVAFEAPGAAAGLIAASEVPSALRSIGAQGALGYAPDLFEWVLGPGEEFSTEPVFYFGYSGAVQRTVSSVSTPLDRAVEGPYLAFVRRHIGIAADTAPMHGPQWMTWAYFYDKIDDPLVRQLAGIASRAGFTEMLLDDGWQKGRLGTQVDTAKFPDFAATSEFIRSQGMALGLWVSCFRDRDSRDLRDMPDSRILPELIRSPQLPGLAMSFTSPWRDYYVSDLVATARRYGVRYFKQDFSNILYGDLAEGHESRTRRESLLRGLRGLLAVQASLRKAAPEIVNEITHEIYWGTPGVPADLAALKHTARYHIPPNECLGSDIAREFRGRPISAAEHAETLRQGCWLARQRLYSHRGLPLYPLEFYAAATTNHEGSLTSDIQDRQIASWLMGVPSCFSGDARTLSEANIAHYRKRLDEVQRLQKTYGIYQRFQFSGVPEPTDTDWHWWGKLNAGGYGAVVVLRGAAGEPRRQVNVPWVMREKQYRVKGLFTGKSYGTVSGARLQDTGLLVELPIYGQDVLEIAP